MLKYTTWSLPLLRKHLRMYFIPRAVNRKQIKLLLCAKDVTTSGASKVDIHSTVMLMSLFLQYVVTTSCARTVCYVTGRGSDKKSKSLQTLYDTLGSQKCNALSGLHAFSGAYITGSFAGKGKVICWKRKSNLLDCVWESKQRYFKSPKKFRL